MNAFFHFHFGGCRRYTVPVLTRIIFHTQKTKKIRLNCNKNFAGWAKTIRAAIASDGFFIRYHSFPPPCAFSTVVLFHVRLLIWFQSTFLCVDFLVFFHAVWTLYGKYIACRGLASNPIFLFYAQNIRK